jgi:phosphatidylglycerophosphate synthase
MSQLSTDPAVAISGTSIAQVYRATLKREDLLFNVYVCRPLAAVLVYWLRGTRVAPNQITFFSLLLAVAAAAALTLVAWPRGLWLGVLVYELSYVFDKVDGMLARSRGAASATGHLLDFLMDEIKAFLILAAMAVGAYLQGGGVALLLWGLLGVVCLASGIAITTFQRRPEVLAAGHVSSSSPPSGGASTPLAPRRTARASAVRLAEAVGRFFIHYPSYIWLAALLSDARVYLYPYVVVNALYAARSLFGLVLRYGGPLPRRS